MLNSNIVEAGERSVVRRCGSDVSGPQAQQNSQLLPGIPDDITVSQISPRLFWKDIYRLTSVSRIWEATIKSRKIFQARCRSTFGSKDTLFAFQAECENEDEPDLTFWNIILYSPEDPLRRSGFSLDCFRMEGACCEYNGLYALPPNRDKFGSLKCECIFLEGKLYTLSKPKARGKSRGKVIQSKVYVYDLVTQEQWRPCSPLKGISDWFWCGVIDRKIYAFSESVNKSGDSSATYAVYDPQENSWFHVNSWTPSRFAFRDKYEYQNRQFIQRYLKITRVGEELFVHGAPTCNYLQVDNDQSHRDLIAADVYHTVTNKWRRVENFRRHQWDIIMWIDGRVHRIDRDSMEVYDTGTNMWNMKLRSSFSEKLLEDFFHELLCYLGWDLDDPVNEAEYEELVRVNYQELMHFVYGVVVKDTIFMILNWRLDNWGEGPQSGSHLRIVSSRWPRGSEENAEGLNFELWDSHPIHHRRDENWFSGLFKCAVQL